MTDEELKALVERLDQMGRIDGVLTMSLTTIIAVEDTQAAASAIRQLMRERDDARENSRRNAAEAHSYLSQLLERP